MPPTDRARTSAEKIFKAAMRKHGWNIYRDDDTGRLVTNCYQREVAGLSKLLGVELEVVAKLGALVKAAADVGIDSAKLALALQRIRIEAQPCGYAVLEDIGESKPNVFALEVTRKEAMESSQRTSCSMDVVPCFTLL